jgi:VIT1/CCC1 family predicted Fe2+/Mn2+ transporter
MSALTVYENITGVFGNYHAIIHCISIGIYYIEMIVFGIETVVPTTIVGHYGRDQ